MSQATFTLIPFGRCSRKDFYHHRALSPRPAMEPTCTRCWLRTFCKLCLSEELNNPIDIDSASTALYPRVKPIHTQSKSESNNNNVTFCALKAHTYTERQQRLCAPRCNSYTTTYICTLRRQRTQFFAHIQNMRNAVCILNRSIFPAFSDQFNTHRNHM